MWVLECDGDILSNKRIWLRPGKTYLFGRTKPETSRYQTGFRINHKTVSRKHLTITVASSGPEEAPSVNKRTELTFEDAGTKAGTKIDNERINSGRKKAYSGAQHTFTLSSYEHAFRVTWKSVVLSFTFSSKEFKDGRDPMQPVLQRLAGLDIKAISNYAGSKTTHVVASKRNTARGLQALIQCARIVTDEFVTAIEVAATPSDLNHLESFAPLEEDFDAAWPDDSAFLPPPGREPGVKDPELFEPDPTRQDIFNGMTFIFCDPRQFENLQPPITDGGGKALLFEVEFGETAASELHRFVKDVAGEKGDGELGDDSQVIFVKFGAPQGHEDWSNQLHHDLAIALGRRLMEQNEFLDAILTKEPAKLIRRVDPDLAQDAAGPNIVSSSANTDDSARQSEVPEAVAETKPVASRLRSRTPIAPIFQGFDAGFNPNEIEYDGVGKRPDAEDDDSTTSGVNGMNSSQDRPRAGSKRPAESDSDLQEIDERMFPGAAIMKRRKLEGKDQEKRKAPRDERSSRSRSTTAPPVEVKEKKVKAETDIRAVAMSRRQEFDDRAEEDENGTPGLENMTVSQMKELAVVEELPMPERQPLAERDRQGTNDRWRDEWNGRKNFKNFRRQGDSENALRRSNQSVLVPLEEFKRRESGLGANYWGDREKRPTHRYRQKVRAGWDDDVDEGDEGNAPADQRTQKSKTSRITDTQDPSEVNDSVLPDDEASVEVPEGDDDDPDVIEIDSLHTSRSNGNATQGSASQPSRVPTKRAMTQSSGEKMTAASKRQKRGGDDTQRTRATGDGDSDDDLKFKFRRRTQRE